MIQVYCDGEAGTNRWLKENHGNVEIIDTKLAINENGEMIMVTYKEKQQEEYIEFNLNLPVKVQLYEKGKEILRARHREILGKTNIEYKEKEVDSEGYSEFQMWQLMSNFGEHMYMGNDNPFSLNIKLKIQ